MLTPECLRTADPCFPLLQPTPPNCIRTSTHLAPHDSHRAGRLKRRRLVVALVCLVSVSSVPAQQLQLAGTNRLQVFHVHMKCCSDGSSCLEKQDEAQLFSDDMKAWAATNSGPYIFAGDLNEDEQNPECTLSATYHPITTLITNGGLAEFKPTTLSGEYRTWSTANTTPSIRFDYILEATNRLSIVTASVFG